MSLLSSRRRHGVSPPALTWSEAANRLGVHRDHVGWLVRMGHLSAVEDENSHVDQASVEELLHDRSEWISATTAAELLGDTLYGVWKAVEAGHITQRRRGKRPSLSRSSVLTYRTWSNVQAEQEAARDAERRRLKEPPDTDHVWITPAVLALMAGYREARARQLLAAGRIPAVRIGTRWWIRRDHAEQLIAARAITRARRTTP